MAGGVAVATALLQLQPQWWMYDRVQLWQQPWRLLTGQWVHVGWVHWAMNMLALTIILGLFMPQRPVRWVGQVLVMSLGISVALWVSLPGLDYYAGFSGVLHGLVALGMVHWLGQPSERRWGIWLGLGLLFKLGHEAWWGSAVQHWIGAPVIVQAHQWGALWGLLLGIFSAYGQNAHRV